MAEVKIKKLKFFFLILCIIQLFYIFHFRSGFKYEIIKNPFNESSGISYALSADVIESNSILKKQKAINFNLSESLKKDTYLYQRTIEFNYPIRINESSKLVFFLNTEDIPNTCKVIETGKYLKLTQC
jgi:hypothetical protein